MLLKKKKSKGIFLKKYLFSWKKKEARFAFCF